VSDGDRGRGAGPGAEPAEADERLADLVFRMGEHAGRLALSMDLITDALCLAGQHPAWCHQRSRAMPKDIGLILDDLARAKELVQTVFLALRDERRGS
jgi:hypothetical protein